MFLSLLLFNLFSNKSFLLFNLNNNIETLVEIEIIESQPKIKKCICGKNIIWKTLLYFKLKEYT